MGVDMRVYLPANVRVRNVAGVMGAYAGCPVSKDFFRCGGGGWSAHADGVEVKSASLPEMVSIFIRTPMVDGETVHHCNYHFESEGGRIGRLMLPRSTAFWIALMTRVVDFFGGTIDYQDCDESECDYAVPEKTWQENSPSDGDEWYSFQNRVLAIVPITEDEWNAADKFAAYKVDR